MNQPEKKYTVVGVGEVLWDIYRDHRYVGGAPSNFAIHATQLGDEGVLVARVGDDAMGRELIQSLRQRQLGVEHVQIDANKVTGTVMVSLDALGVPSFRCSHDVAFDYLQYVPELETLAKRAEAILFGTLAQRSIISRKTILRFLQAAPNAVRIFDVNSRAGVEALRTIVPDSLALANVIKMSRAETVLLQQIFRRAGESRPKFVDFLIKKYHLRLVAITYGDFGCEVYDGNTMRKVEGLPVQAVDATGAGDAFVAGLVHQLLRGAPLRELAEFANLLGAFVCTKNGATPVFDRQDIETFRESL
jgi:fructokinase